MRGVNGRLLIMSGIISCTIPINGIWILFFKICQKTLGMKNLLLSKRENTDRVSLNANEYWYILVCFIIYITWSAEFLYMSYGPDEYMRYDVPKYIFETGMIPYGWEESIRNHIWGFSYGFSFTITYLVSALFMKIAAIFIGPYPQILLIAARLTSVLSMIGVCWISLRLVKRISCRTIRWTFVVPMTLTPQIVFLASYQNLESFTLFGVMLIIESWIIGISTHWNLRSCIELAFGLSVCFLGYEYSWGFILGSFLLYCIWFLFHIKTITFSAFIKKGLIIFAIVICMASWRFIRNALIYDGDFIGLHTRELYGELYALEEYKPSMRLTHYNNGYTCLDMIRNSNWIEMTWKSMFSVLGYMNIMASDWVYAGFNMIIPLALFGMIPTQRNNKQFLWFLFTSLFCVAITVGISLYYSWKVDYQPQGRYIIYILPILLLFNMKGIDNILGFMRKNAKHLSECALRRMECIITSVVSCFIVFALIEAFLHCVIVFINMQ